MLGKGSNKNHLIKLSSNSVSSILRDKKMSVEDIEGDGGKTIRFNDE